MQDSNIKTGTQAEQFVAQELAKKGAFVGDFNKGRTGSQPFDQLAITENFTWAYDVKHCRIDRFEFRRVEANQTSALNYIHDEINNAYVICGFALVHEDEIYFLSLFEYRMIKATGRKSCKVSNLPKLLEVIS